MPMSTSSSSTNPTQLVARSLYQDLSRGGFDAVQIVAVATALIGEVTHHLGAKRTERRGGDAAATPRTRSG